MESITDSLINRIQSSSNFEQLVKALREAGLRFLPIKYIYGIGHLAIEPDCYLKEVFLGRRPRANVILLAPDDRVANKHYAHYWSKYIHVETDRQKCIALQPLAEQTLLQENIDDYCMNDAGPASVYPINAIWGDRPPLLSVSEADRAWGIEWLKRQGFSPHSWFVCVHARENGQRPQDPAHSHRNVDINTYIPAIQEIVKRGGWCIRMGDPNMKPLPPLPGLIDYALHPDRCDRLDVSLFGTCRFFLGCSSGPSCLVASFGIPAILTNIIPASVAAIRSTDIAIYKRLWSRSEERFLRCAEVLDSRWSHANTFAQDFEKTGLDIVDNSEEEILEAVTEMLDRMDGRLTYTPRDDELQSKYQRLVSPTHYGFGSTSRIGRLFLERCMQDETSETSEKEMERIIIETQKPVAFDSPDHIQPWGTARDDSTNPAFNRKLFWWLPTEAISVLDIGCSGGGFVKSILDEGGFAIGVEGSDYSLKRRRAQWATIPDNLFTCDATEKFEIFRLKSRTEKVHLKFNVITAWEFIEHISEENLPSVFANIDNHLAEHGVVIMSVSPNEEIIDGVKLHLCVHDRSWWYRKFEELGFQNHERAVSFFGNDFVRWEENAPGSFHVILTRKGERLPHPSRLSTVGWEYANKGDGLFITKELVRTRALEQDNIRVIDVGARGGFEPHWRIYGDQIELIGFEPNEGECAKLNTRHHQNGPKERFFPNALDSRKNQRKMLSARNSVASSFLPINWPYVERFSKSYDGRVVAESTVKTATLDEFTGQHNLSEVDFLKVDAEGLDLEILKGGIKLIRQSLLGVSIEAFFQPYRIGQPLFPEIHAFLEAEGFSLFGMAPESWKRALAVSHKRTEWCGGGQLMRAQCVYLKDYVRLFHEGAFDYRTLPSTKIMKAISLAEVLGFSDYAAELLAGISEGLVGEEAKYQRSGSMFGTP